MAEQHTLLNPYVDALLTRGGTDLLFTAGSPAAARVSGRLTPVEARSLQAEDIEQLLASLLSEDLRERFKETGEVDFSVDVPGATRFRGNAFMQRGTVAIALRAIPNQIPSFDSLGIPEPVRRFAELPQGLVLVTGPTGSGKSTTLASILDVINSNRPVHILTIEDPIEYVHDHKLAVVNQREVGQDTHSFASALRNALREDPDVLLVGEMRDPESIATALTVAETGHLVFATLHTNDAAQALDRIVDVFPAERQQQIRVQLSASLAGVVSQRLLPRSGGGLVAGFEVLIATSAVRNLIKDGKSHQIRNVIMTGQEHGMQTLETSLNQLVANGLVTREDAVARSLFPKDITA